MTSDHLQEFPRAALPVIPHPIAPNREALLAEAEHLHLQGIGRLARAERHAAKDAAAADVGAYLAEVAATREAVRQRLEAQARAWWQALSTNDEATVCDAVNAAFADNPAAGCALGLSDGVMSVLVRQPDLASMPERVPALTPGGRATLKAMTKKDRVSLWLLSMASHVVATLKEGFATAPGVTAIELAVISRLPETAGLAVVLHGSWTREVIASTPWRTNADAAAVLGIGQDVACAVRTNAAGATMGTLRPLDISGHPGLAQLLRDAVDTDDSETDLEAADAVVNERHEPGPAEDPYRVESFEAWFRRRAQGPAQQGRAQLAPNQSAPIPAGQVRATLSWSGATPDLSVFLLDANGRVGGDEDLVFYNQPARRDGSARLDPGSAGTARAAVLDLDRTPQQVARIALVAGVEQTFGTGAIVRIEVAGLIYAPPLDPNAGAVTMLELYRAGPSWAVWAVGHCWGGGLAEAAARYGVDVDG